MTRIKSWRPVLEECPRINADRRMKASSMLGLAWSGAFSVETDVYGYRLVENISWVCTATRFNGRRVWFFCPRCQKRYKNLYLSPNAHSWWCRKCHSLAYRSQRLHRDMLWESVTKYERRKNKIVLRLKNKYLRRPTRTLLMLKVRILSRLVTRGLMGFMEHKAKKANYGS